MVKPAYLIGAALSGLLLGWFLWGRSPSPAVVQAAIDRAHRAEETARRNAQTVRILVQQAGILTQRADSLAAVGRQRRQEGRTHLAAADTAVARGDTATGLGELRAAHASCEAGAVADSLALGACRAAGERKDTALALHAQTIDSLIGATGQAVTVLGRLKPRSWAVGPVWSPQGWGAQIERDVGPVRLSGSGLIAKEPEVRVGVLLKF